MRIAVIMPTIRVQAGRVAELFLQDAALSGIDLGNVSLYFSIDPPLSANAGALQPHEEYASRLRLVRYIDERRRVALAQDLLDHCEVNPPALERLLIRRSYASARNAALLEALNDSNDFAISIDDNVFPVAPKKVDKRQLEWIGVSFMRTHLSRLAAGADITRGAYLGYASPLVDLSSVVPQACRSALGLALSLGNEVLAPDCLSAPPFVRMLTTSGEDDIQLDCESSEKGIVIYGGNVGISLRALREGRIPAFFCPLDARGEDTFFGLCLPCEARVDTVPAFVFHDPFCLYPGLLEHRYPTSLMLRVHPNGNNLQRFVNAFHLPIRYIFS